jgi:hypothetical protein
MKKWVMHIEEYGALPPEGDDAGDAGDVDSAIDLGWTSLKPPGNAAHAGEDAGQKGTTRARAGAGRDESEGGGSDTLAAGLARMVFSRDW